MHIPRQYIVNEENQRIAVQLDILTFEKIEEVLENFGLAEQMKKVELEDSLDLDKARAFYAAQSSPE